MSWLDRLRHKKEGNSPQATSYDPKLVTRFEAQHNTLIKLLGKVEEAATQENIDAIIPHLNKFQQVAAEHIEEENKRFYNYLGHYVDDEEHRQLVGEMKREMDDIIDTVSQFITDYKREGINDNNLDAFRNTLTTIHSLVTDRIDREESSLYTLYLPPESYFE